MKGIVLAGGKSSRMGTDKCLLKYDNQTFIQKAASLLQSICQDIVVSSPNKHFEKFDLDVVVDEFSDIGPIGGIYSALKHSDSETNIIIPCDVPLLNKDLLLFLLSKSHKFEIVVPVFHQKIEPLVGIFKKSIVKIIQKNIEEKKYKISEILKQARTNFIEIEPQMPFYDTNLFLNINRPEDYQKFLEIKKSL
jgi:molybdopterin-guanine dinucleotide biosynthesis protein A